VCVVESMPVGHREEENLERAGGPLWTADRKGFLGKGEFVKRPCRVT
jgi:hypothetical protein